MIFSVSLDRPEVSLARCSRCRGENRSAFPAERYQEGFFFFCLSMSHYSVLIIGKHPEAQLDPYWELDLPPDILRDDPRAEFFTEVPAGRFEEKVREVIATVEPGHPELANRYRRLLEEGRVEDILESWFGGEKGDVGDWGHYRNPVAKWDWCQLGGRHAGKLLLKLGRSGVLSPESREDGARFSPQEVNQARFGDIDWQETRKRFSPFAVLKHGQWHEWGEMGAFGMVSDPKPDAVWEDEISRLLKDVPDDEIVSIYDCHC